MSCHVESCGTVTRPTLHCQLTFHTQLIWIKHDRVRWLSRRLPIPYRISGIWSSSFLRRSIKLGYYPGDGLMFEELCGVANDRLFAKIENNEFHVLYNCLPSKQRNCMGTTCVKGSIHSSYQLKTTETLSTAFSSKIYNYLSCLNSLLYQLAVWQVMMFNKIIL